MIIKLLIIISICLSGCCLESHDSVRRERIFLKCVELMSGNNHEDVDDIIYECDRSADVQTATFFKCSEE